MTSRFVCLFMVVLFGTMCGLRMMCASICAWMLLWLRSMRHQHKDASPNSSHNGAFCCTSLYIFSNTVCWNTAESLCCRKQTHSSHHSYLGHRIHIRIYICKVAVHAPRPLRKNWIQWKLKTQWTINPPACNRQLRMLITPYYPSIMIQPHLTKSSINYTW